MRLNDDLQAGYDAIIHQPFDRVSRLVFSDMIEESGLEFAFDWAKALRCNDTADDLPWVMSLHELTSDAGIEAIERVVYYRYSYLPEAFLDGYFNAVIRGGLIDEITLTSQQFLDHAHEIVRRHPVRRWNITDVRLFRGRSLSWLTTSHRLIVANLPRTAQSSRKAWSDAAAVYPLNEPEQNHYFRLRKFAFLAARNLAGLPEVEYAELLPHQSGSNVAVIVEVIRKWVAKRVKNG